MKKLLFLLLFVSLNAFAELRIYYLYTSLRIVISDIPCDSGKGFKASAQRMDKLYISGCWTRMEKYPDMIHLDWANGDWSELPYDKFELVENL